MVKKQKSTTWDLLFFFIFVASITIYLLSYLSIRNESINVHSNIQELRNKRITYINKLNIMRSEQKLLSSQSRIQQVAKEKFNMFTPVPESLIVYLEDIK